MNSLKLSKRVIGIALSVLFVNAALADSTTDARIQAYKANKLIPENVILPTSTGAADSDEVVVFSSNNLSWNSDTAENAVLGGLKAKYGEMTIDELRAAMGPSGTFDDELCDWTEEGWLLGVTPEQQEIRDYLSLIANNKLQSDNLGSVEALAYLQEQFDSFLGVYHYGGNLSAFPCEGLDFTGRSLAGFDLSNCTGITAEQILSARYIDSTVLPAITFTGSESFDGKYLYGTDLSRCTGITAEQILSADDISGTKLPAITFTGNESFNGKDLSSVDLRQCTGITAEQIMSASNLKSIKLPAITFTGSESFEGKNLSYTDLSRCTGITATQIGSAKNVSDIRMTTAQYNEWKSTLQSKFNGKYVYVDGVRTKIQ